MARVVTQASASAPTRPASSRDLHTTILLLAPAVVFLLLLFTVPIAYVLVLSVTEPSLSFENYRRLFTVPLYGYVLLNTFYLSLIVTVLCLLLGYPMAYVARRRSGWIVWTILTIVGASFWTGFVIRTYAWFIILGNRGVIAATAEVLGLGHPPQLLFTSFASIVGMVHILLPFMVFALYAVMSRINLDQLRAAESLGATPARAFREVFLPLSMPGIVNGSILVFTICLGFYVTPVLLGAPRDMMISQLISQQIDQLLAWGFASALAVVLLVATMIILAIYNRYAGLDRLWG
jgi:putative spermidine/putrescine transport system permease protein